jgi:CHAT domain-containing protein
MDTDVFLQNLRDLSLEDGKRYIQEHIADVSDYAALGNLLADEALRLLYIDPFISLKVSELLIRYGAYTHHTLSYALGLKAKGDVLQRIGHYKAAIDCLDAAGDEFIHLGDEGNWARSRISWIIAAAWLGKVEEALQQAGSAREVFLELGERYWACIIDHNTAVIYDHIGQYQNALKLYERIISIYPTLTDQNEISIKRDIAMAELNQAENLGWLGEFEQAYHLHQKAQESFISLGETSLFISSEITLADLDYTQGYYGSALRRYYQIRDNLIQNEVSDSLLLAELNLWMADCLVKLNKAKEACQLVAEAVEVYRELGTSLQISNALREYAATLEASGSLNEALASLEEASALFSFRGFDHYASATKLQEAELLLEMGSYNLAYRKARSIKEYFDAQGLISRSLRASLVMANAIIENVWNATITNRDEVHQTFEDAMVLCEQVARIARKHNLREQIYKSQRILGRLATYQGNLSKAARYYRSAINQIEKILNNLSYDLSPTFLHTTWTVYEDMIELCLKRGQAEQAFNFLEQARSSALRQYLNKSRRSAHEKKESEGSISHTELQMSSAAVLRTQYELRDWQQQYHDYSVLLKNIDTSVSPTINEEIIQVELKRCEAKLSELFERLHLYQLEIHDNSKNTHLKKEVNLIHTETSSRRFEITQLIQSLLPDQLILSYYLHGEKLIIFAITAEGMITYENPDGAVQLEYLLPLLHSHLQPGGWPDPQHPQQQVIRRLLNKLYDLLITPVIKLMTSHTGYLTIVPYGPLHQLPFHALYDGTQFLIEKFQINYLPACNTLLYLDRGEDKLLHGFEIVDDPTASPLVFGYSNDGHLQRVLEEAKMLGIMLNGHCYLEEEATIKRLFEQSHGSPIIHLATHGQSRLDAPNFSFVRLADGQLTAIDAFNLDLKTCELVTLSGCETGLALSGGGDEQLGLGQAFLAAGAKSLVMSLWSVEDEATSELMQIFYQNLIEGYSKIQALQAAQCTLLQSTSSRFAHPYFWAAFRLVGDGSPLKNKRAKESSVGFATEQLKKVIPSVSFRE